MSFLAQRLVKVACQSSRLDKLNSRSVLLVSHTAAFRAFSVTPQLLQRPKTATPAFDVTSASATDVTQDKRVEEEQKCQAVFDSVNKQLAASVEGRIFAVVHLCGKQYKITAGDIILVEGYWPPTIGDEISLDKVLLAGGRDFTIIGRPILESGLVNVTATIIEKTLTHTKTHFKMKRRKQFMRINFQRSPNTMIRINTIEVCRPVGSTNTQAVNSDVRIF